MQVNQATLAALFKGYRTQFLEAYYAAKPKWQVFAMKTPSSAAEELYHWLGSMSGLHEFTGKAIIDNLTASKYVITNKEFQKIIAVRRADIERDSYGIYNTRMQILGALAAKHPDELVANLLINGFNTVDYTGKNFFDTNKTQDPGGPVTLTNKGTDKLSPISFQNARAAIKSVQNSNGIPMDIGEELTLVIPPALETVGKQILEADNIAQFATQGGDIVGVANVANTNKGSAKLEVWSQLSSAANQWYLLANGLPVKPLILQVEKEVELTSVTNPDQEHVFLNNEFLYKAYLRDNAGYGLPQLAWGSTGTTQQADYTGP
jgi:phage major head subunit gpT-like protein